MLTIGLRYAANICQITTNDISFIMLQTGIEILYYLDDLAGIEHNDKENFAYNCFGAVLQKYGFEEALEKAPLLLFFLGLLL